MRTSSPPSTRVTTPENKSKGKILVLVEIKLIFCIFPFRMEEIRQYYKFRPDEIFRRITVTSLVTLMLEVSKLEYQEEDAERLTNQIREDQESLQQTSKAEATPAPPQEASMEPQEMVQEAAKEEEEVDDSCEADSLDSAIDPEEHTRQLEDDQDDGYIDSIVFKGKKIRKGGGLHSHHFSSVGNLLQVY